MVGRVGKPHGLAGEVYVEVISDDPRRFQPGSTVIHERLGRLTVESSRPHRARTLVKFQEVDGRDDAESLRGGLFVEHDEARDLSEGEFWEHQLVGATVVDTEDREVGTLRRILPGPAQDLLVVDTPNGERLVPFVQDIVVEVDVARRTVRVDAPAGLLDA